MAPEIRRSGISRRLLLGAGVLGAAVLWGGATVARLTRDPSGPKNAGRIADVDGIALPLQPAANVPAYDPALPWLAKGGEINDVSELSLTPVYGVVEVSEEAHVAAALAFARANGLKVSVAAVRHSMGGHAFDDNALVLDMRKFDRVELDANANTITVQPGATWHDHPEPAASALRRQGDAVDRHLFRRRIDFGQCPRHGPSGGFRRRKHPVDADHARRRQHRFLLAHRKSRDLHPCGRRLRPVRRHFVGCARCRRQRSLSDRARGHPLGGFSCILRKDAGAGQKCRPVLRASVDGARQLSSKT